MSLRIFAILLLALASLSFVSVSARGEQALIHSYTHTLIHSHTHTLIHSHTHTGGEGGEEGVRLTEPERVKQWHERNTWPPTWQPESEQFREFQRVRDGHISQYITIIDTIIHNYTQLYRLTTLTTPIYSMTMTY
jgi:hypothetical protein